MMMKGKFLTTLLGVAALLFIAALPVRTMAADGAAKASAAKKTVEQKKTLKKIPLRIHHIPDPKATDVGSQIQVALLDEFRRQNPQVELSRFGGITIANIGNESKLMLAIAGGAAPDVMRVNFRMSDTYIQQRFIYPLDGYINSDPELKSVKNYLKMIPDAIRPVVYRDGPAVDNFKAGDHVWFMGKNLLVRALFWRKDLFQDAGLDPERPPQNWDELLDYARRISDPSRDKYGISIATGQQAAWDYMPYLWGAGGEAVVKDEKGQWRAAFGTREAAVGLEFYMRLTTERWIDSDGVEQRGYSTANADERSMKLAQQAGRLGMFSNYMGDERSGGGVDPSLVGCASFPVGPSGVRATEVNMGLEGIFAGLAGRRNSEGVYVSAKEIRDMAWKYIRFMNSKSARKIYTELMISNGQGKLVSPDYLREFGYTEYLKYLPPAWEKTFKESLKNGKAEPFGRNCQLVYLYMTQPLDAAQQLSRDGKLPEGNTPEAREQRIKIFEKLLKDAEKRTNEHMIGRISSEEKQKRTIVASIVAVCLLALFCFVIYNIWKVFSPKDTFSGKKKGWEFRKNWLGYLIMLPAILSILLWVYYPMTSGTQILFQDYHFVGKSEWIGLDNFAGVLFSDEWWSSIWNTFRYMSFLLTLGFCAPIILAILLQEVSCGKIFYRTVFYLPAVMSGLVVIFMWRLFYQSGSSGILNQVVGNILNLFGVNFSPIAWIEDAKWAMFACVIPTIWAGAGPGCLIYLAALKGVPDDTYEAAEIDGANFFQKIWHVTFPTLKALIIINFVGAFISASQSGGMILIMTFGRANTEVAELHIFKEAYTNLRFGSAIAMAWVLGSMTLLFTIQNLKRLSKMEFKTTGGK